MKLNITVKNLGNLKTGTVKIRPLTVLAGKNATGKSFFTKSLYSIFSVLNKNVLHADITKNIKKIILKAHVFNIRLIHKGKNDNIQFENILNELIDLQSHLDGLKYEGIDSYIFHTSSIFKEVDKFLSVFEYYWSNMTQGKKKSVAIQIKELGICFKHLKENLQNSKQRYVKLLDANLSDEIKENFQIANLSELITFNEKECEILLAGESLNVSFNTNNRISFNLNFKFINEISGLSRVVFFESPTYWSVREALNKSKEVEHKDDLTGVSKYFYDLDKALNTKSKNEPIEEILQLAKNIKKEIGGEFIFDGGQLYFVDNNGKTIDKNLVSFGMTNLGMVQALLRNNIISKGSFVFFDEPETNLHPEWQVLLANVIIALAKNGVNVVIATHSLDMIKVLEVKTKGENSNFIAINHFKNNKVVNAKIKTVLDDLASPFYDLYMDNL